MATVPAKSQRSKKGKRPDKRPSRPRYWNSGRLALRKIRNLVRSGYSPREALRLWTETRKRHQGVIPSFSKIDNLPR